VCSTGLTSGWRRKHVMLSLVRRIPHLELEERDLISTAARTRTNGIVLVQVCNTEDGNGRVPNESLRDSPVSWEDALISSK
jgi:hypothetical protein